MTDIAIGGGCLIKRRFSAVEDARFLAMLDVIRQADIAFAHLEGTICDPDAPDVYPAAEAGWTWRRTPRYFADELKWAGFDIVSHASNHAMDFMYGGLSATWDALRRAGLPYAGTGMNLNEARKPVFMDTGKARFALISASSSTANWARAANPIRDERGRPGINQLRVHNALDAAAMAVVKDLAIRMGQWVTEVGDDLLVSPPGLHNSVTRYVKNPAPGIALVADEDDVKANLRSVRDAKGEADLVMFHLHNHEWNLGDAISSPPAFTRALAHDAIDAGADLFLAEGAHALLRGIEIYKGKPIFYDVGDLFKDGNSKTRQITEYYWLKGRNSEAAPWRVATVDSIEVQDLQRLPTATNPPGGYNTGRVLAVIVPVCRYDEAGKLRQVTLYPALHLKGSHALNGLPGLATGAQAKLIIEYLAELSAPFGTTIRLAGDVGVIDIA